MKKIDMYMMATKTIHQLGDISRDIPNLCYVNEEHDDHYLGSWITGFDFINVKFSKKTTHDLTEEEIKEYNKNTYQISKQPLYKLNIKGSK